MIYIYITYCLLAKASVWEFSTWSVPNFGMVSSTINFTWSSSEVFEIQRWLNTTNASHSPEIKTRTVSANMNNIIFAKKQLNSSKSCSQSASKCWKIGAKRCVHLDDGKIRILTAGTGPQDLGATVRTAEKLQLELSIWRQFQVKVTNKTGVRHGNINSCLLVSNNSYSSYCFLFLNVSFDQSIVTLYIGCFTGTMRNHQWFGKSWKNMGNFPAMWQISCEVEVANLSFDLICNL